MATKAEAYRYRAERSGAKLPKRPRRPRRDHPIDTAQPGVSATDRKAGDASTAARNKSKAAAKKAPYVLEDSRARPSRRSTRRSRNRQQPGSNLKRLQRRAKRLRARRAHERKKLKA
jgi:hypothetical protein